MDALRTAYSVEGTSSSGSESQEWKLQAQAAEAVSRENGAACPLSVCDTATSVHRRSRKRFRAEHEAPSARIRTFPHVPGNYAFHVYVPVLIPVSERPALLTQLLRACRLMPGLHPMDSELPTLPPSAPTSPSTPAGPSPPAAPNLTAAPAAAAAGPSSRTISRVPPQRETCARLALSRLLAAPLHCSLSRTVPLRLPQIGPLVALLRRNLRPQKRFLLRLSRWSPFANDEGTRSFLALEATSEGVREFCAAVSAVNRAFLLHQLPQYYEPPRPHASLLWALGDRQEALAAVAAALHSSAGETGGEQGLRVEVAAVVCRAGKRVFSVWEGQ